MQDIQFKAASGQFNIDEAQGIVECFVAGIGNKDSVGDIVISGAFAKSLMRRKPRVVWGHNWNDPIGKVLEIYEVPPNDPRLPAKMKAAGIGGLYAKVQFNLNSEKGKEAFTNVAFFGEEQEWSIGYKTLDAIYDNSKQANVLREVELYELSPVLHGANQLTGTISVKSDEEKMHMAMGMGMPSGMIAVTEKPKGPVDPFEQGIAQPVDSDRMAALERELTSRTDGPIKIMKANESSVVFMKPGKGVFRLGYYFDGEQFMFGKPEKLGQTMIIQAPIGPKPPMNRPGRPGHQRVPNFPNVVSKPSAEEPKVPVKYGTDVASGFFNLDNEKTSNSASKKPSDGDSPTANSSIIHQLSNIVSSLQNIINSNEQKSLLMIPCEVKNLFETKQALDPIFDYYRLETHVTEDGIIISSDIDVDAYEAIDTATKNLFSRIGRRIGGVPKVRRGRAARSLSRIEGILDPRLRRDRDGDGVIFDGTWREMPDPSKVPNVPQNMLQGARSESDKPKPTVNKNPQKGKVDPTQTWFRDLPKHLKPLPFEITETEKSKLAQMFNGYLAGPGKNLPEDHVIRRTAKALTEAKRITLLGSMPTDKGFSILKNKQGRTFLPHITQEMADGLKKLWPKVSKDMKLINIPGKKGKKQRGRTPFEIFDQFLEKGSYARTNLGRDHKGKHKKRENRVAPIRGARAKKDAVRKGKESALAGQKQTGKNNVLDNPIIEVSLVQSLDDEAKPIFDASGKPVMTISDYKITSPLTRTPNNPKPVFDPDSLWIRNGVLPKNWALMSASERLDWWIENEEEVRRKIIPGNDENGNQLGDSRVRSNIIKTLRAINDVLISDEDEESQNKNQEKLDDDDEIVDDVLPDGQPTKRTRKEQRDELQRLLARTSPNEQIQRRARIEQNLPLDGRRRAKPTQKPARQNAEQDNRNKYEKAFDLVNANLDKNRNMASDEIVDIAKDTISQSASSLRDDDGRITDQTLADTSENLGTGILYIESLNRQRRLTVEDQKILGNLKTIKASLDDEMERRGNRSRREDEEDELSVEGLAEGLVRRGDQEEIYGVDDEEDRGDFDASREDFEDVRKRRRNRNRTEEENEFLGDEEDGGDRQIFEGEIPRYGNEDDDGGGGARSSSSSRTRQNPKTIDSSLKKARQFQQLYSRRREASSGARSRSSLIEDSDMARISADIMWWKQIERSLAKEIRNAPSEPIRRGLEILNRKIKGSFPNRSTRSIKLTAKQADLILDAVMAVIDRQMTAGKDGGVGSRAELFAELLEKVSSSALSTFMGKK